MKKFTDLTIDERAELTNDEINKYIDFRCAEHGAPLMCACPKKVEETILPKTDSFYQISIGYWDLFTKADADAIVAFINSKKAYTNKNVGNYQSPQYVVIGKDAGGYDRARSSEKSYYSLADAEAQHLIDSEQKLEVDTYEAEKTRYDEAVEARQEHHDIIYEDIAEACKQVGDRVRHLNEWNTYLNLADGNYNTAKNFFVNRYDEDIYEAIIVPYIGAVSEKILEE